MVPRPWKPQVPCYAHPPPSSTPSPSSPLLHAAATSTDIQMQACRQTHTRAHIHMQRRIIIRTCWPVLLRRREMLSNSAFQHSTSDYLFSFTGRFELVMCFPFSVGLASLSLSPSLSPSLSLSLYHSLFISFPPLSLWNTLGIPPSPVHEIHSDRNPEVRPFSIWVDTVLSDWNT